MNEASDSAVGWQTLKPGDRVEVTLKGQIEGIDSQGDLKVTWTLGGGQSSYLMADVADAATWRRLPDPLPTTAGTVVEATVNGERRRLISDGDAGSSGNAACWFDPPRMAWHKSASLSDWRVLLAGPVQS